MKLVGKEGLLLLALTFCHSESKCENANGILKSAGDCAVLMLSRKGKKKVIVNGNGSENGAVLSGDVCVAASGALESIGKGAIDGNSIFEPKATASGDVEDFTTGTVKLNADLSDKVQDAVAASRFLGKKQCTVTLSSLPDVLDLRKYGKRNVYICTSGVLKVTSDVTVKGGNKNKAIFNIKGGLMTEKVKILGAGSIDPESIIWNVQSGDIDVRDSELDGSILGIRSKVDLVQSEVNGQVISGSVIRLLSGSAVNCNAPPSPSPSPTGAVANGPRAVKPSSIKVQAKYWGTTSDTGNQNSPVAIGNLLYFVSQKEGIIYYSTPSRNSTLRKLFDADEDKGLKIWDAEDSAGKRKEEKVINIAGNMKDKRSVYVGFTTTSRPTKVKVYDMPVLPGICCEDKRFVEDLYRLKPVPVYRIIYKFRIKGSYKNGNRRLTNPEPILAFEMQDNHLAGGMVGLPDGRLLFATGDALPWSDGDSAPQDDSSHLSKLLIIDPNKKTFEVAAKGIRNVQHIEYHATDKNQLLFSDIGGRVAEEVNIVSVSDLLDTTTIENFGWGRNADKKAREGTFYISYAPPQTIAGAPYEGDAPIPETGFIQPHAQYNRDETDPFVAISGPVTATKQFGSLTTLFGDLRSGKLFGTIDGLETTDATVYELNLVDEFNKPTSLETLAGGRPDPRFFRSPSGHAMVLLEATGDYYQLSVVETSAEEKQG